MTPISKGDEGTPVETVPATATLPVSGVTQLTFSQSPSKPPDGKQIHARRPLPMTSEGREKS